MNARAVLRYGVGCFLVALLAAVSVALLVPAPHVREHGAWGLAGWGVASLGALVCGTCLVRAHGQLGARFAVILSGGMLARLAAYAAGGAGAWAGCCREAVLAYVVGLGTAYLPTQIYEIAWFARRSGGG